MEDLILRRRYTSVHGFWLFLMVDKRELMGILWAHTGTKG